MKKEEKKAPAKKAKREPNKWQLHVKATQAQNPDKKLSEVLKIAAKSYKK